MLDVRALDFVAPDDPRRALAILLSGQVAGTDHAQHGHWPYTQHLGSFLHGMFATRSAFARFLDIYAMLIAEGANS